MPFNVNASDLISKVEIRSGVSPPVVFTGSDLDQMLKDKQKSDTPAFLRIVKPAMIVSSPYFAYTVAPAGMPGPDDYKWFRFKAFLGTIALVGGIFALGYAAGAKKTKRRVNRRLAEMNLPIFR